MNNDVILKWVGGWSHHFVFVWGSKNSSILHLPCFFLTYPSPPAFVAWYCKQQSLGVGHGEITHLLSLSSTFQSLPLPSPDQHHRSLWLSCGEHHSGRTSRIYHSGGPARTLPGTLWQWHTGELPSDHSYCQVCDYVIVVKIKCF